MSSFIFIFKLIYIPIQLFLRNFSMTFEKIDKNLCILKVKILFKHKTLRVRFAIT